MAAGARLPILCSAHGFGHLSRQLALGQGLRAHGVEPVFYTAAPASVVTDFLGPAEVRPWVVDVGIAQRDSLTEDLPATRARLAERMADAAVDALARELAGAPAAVVDVSPIALEACRRAGVPALAVGNFDWAWIYRHYPELAAEAARFAEWQAPHPAVSLWPGPGMTGFASVRALGVLGRRRPAVRAWRGAGVLVSFGGFGLGGLAGWLPRLPGVTWVLSPPMERVERDDVAFVEGVPYPSLVAGVDVVLTKPGYGIFTEAALAGTRLVWVDRGAFPEAPFLEEAMRARGDRKAALDAIGPAVEARLADPAPPPLVDDALAPLVEAVRERMRVGT